MGQYNYPAPKAPHYNEPKSVEDCLTQAREIVRKEHGRTAMGPIAKGESILIITLPDQNKFVQEALTIACKEAGAGKVTFLNPSDLTGKKERIFSVEDGWDEVEMLKEGIASGSPETAGPGSGLDGAGP